MKKIPLILVLFVIPLMAQIENDLLLHYEFNGNLIDSSINGYDGTANGVTFGEDRFGNPNGAVYFDGIDDYIDLPNIIELKPNLPVSFSFWIKYADITYENSTVFNTSFEEDVNSGIYMNSNSSTHSIQISYGDGSNFYSPGSRRTYASQGTIEPAVWKHIVIILKSGTDMEIYIDCVEMGGSYSGSGGDLQYSPFPGNLGRHDKSLTNLADYFKGALDDFKYWSKAISPDDIPDLCGQLAVNEVSLDLDNVMVFPNPSDGFIHFFTEGKIINSLTIFNSLGQQVYSGKFQETLDLSSLDKGIYFINFSGDAFFQHKSIIIK